jgi:hypothetical protein
MTERTTCQARLENRDRADWGTDRQCGNPAVAAGWCRVHDPVARRERAEKAAQEQAAYRKAHPTPQDLVRRALLVMVTTDHIRQYLEQHDPKALQQARQALYPAGQ